MIVITQQQIANLFDAAEATAPDLASDIRQGDWVRFNEPHVLAAYQHGRVLSVKNGNVKIKHGARTDPDYFYCTGSSYRRIEHLAEHWRQADVVTHDSFEHDGKTIQVKGLETKWEQIL